MLGMSESPPMPPPGFEQLSTDEKLAYVDALRARVMAGESPDWHLAESRRRRAADAESPMERVSVREAIKQARANLE